VALLRDWLGGDRGFAVLAASSGMVGDVLRLDYRVRISGPEPCIMEQHGYCRVGRRRHRRPAGGLLGWIPLSVTCTTGRARGR
jgi:hypothetical protein